MSQKWKDIKVWRDNMIFQQIEEEVVREMCFDEKTGEKKEIDYKAIRKETERRIAERKTNGNK